MTDRAVVRSGDADCQCGYCAGRRGEPPLSDTELTAKRKAHKAASRKEKTCAKRKSDA